MSKDKKTKKSPLLSDLTQYAKKHSINIEGKTAKRKTVCPTLNSVGLCINVTNDIGYRPVQRSHSELDTILKKIAGAKDEKSRLALQSPLEELMTFTQFANDEGDYGQGLELGLDLLAFHPKGRRSIGYLIPFRRH